MCYFQAFDRTMNDQVEIVARILKNKFSNRKISAIGFSQGSLIIRGYIQIFSGLKGYPNVHDFISFHGPLAGVGGLPKCDPKSSIFGIFCKLIDSLSSEAAYTEYIQNNLAQSNYYREPYSIKKYMTTNYLPCINFEKVCSYPVSGLESLNKLVLVKALEDTIVVPKESEWFGMYQDNSYKTILLLNETFFYSNEDIGIKKLLDAKKLYFETTKGNHMQFSITEITRILRLYLI